MPRGISKKTLICHHCKEPFEVTYAGGRYPKKYCDKEECQEAKRQEQLARMREYKKKKNAYSREGYKWCKSEETKYRCIDCGRKIVWFYQTQEFFGKIYMFRNRFRCKKCYYLLGRRDERVAEGWESHPVALLAESLDELLKPYLRKVLGSEAGDLRGKKAWMVDTVVGSAIRKDLGEEKYRKIFMKWGPD